MELDTAQMMTTAESIISAARAMLVAYSFSVLGAIILIVVGLFMAGALERWTRTGLGRFPSFDETLRRFLSKIVRYAVLVLVGVTVLAQFGVQTASIIAALGAVGLAIGLALQGTLQNIAAGIMLLVLKPFRVGEFIDAGGIAGTVEEIGLFATELKSSDGIYILAPNSTLWNTPVKNFSRNRSRRNDIVVKLGADAPLAEARRIVEDVVREAAPKASAPAPSVFVSERADGAATLTVRYWSPTRQWADSGISLSDEIADALAAAGIPVASIA